MPLNKVHHTKGQLTKVQLAKMQLTKLHLLTKVHINKVQLTKLYFAMVQLNIIIIKGAHCTPCVALEFWVPASVAFIFH